MKKKPNFVWALVAMMLCVSGVGCTQAGSSQSLRDKEVIVAAPPEIVSTTSEKTNTSFAQETAPLETVRHEAKNYIHVERSEDPICDEIYSFLKMPENENYLGFDRPASYPERLFYIPPDNKNFSQITWQESSEDEFKKYLPQEHERLLRYIAREKAKGAALRGIQKVSLDVYNRGIENTIFRVDSSTRERNYLYEEDPVRLGFKRLFNDNAASDVPFKYKRDVLFSDLKSGRNLWLSRYGKKRVGGQPSEVLCIFEYQKVEMEK